MIDGGLEDDLRAEYAAMLRKTSRIGVIAWASLWTLFATLMAVSEGSTALWPSAACVGLLWSCALLVWRTPVLGGLLLTLTSLAAALWSQHPAVRVFVTIPAVFLGVFALLGARRGREPCRATVRRVARDEGSARAPVVLQARASHPQEVGKQVSSCGSNPMTRRAFRQSLLVLAVALALGPGRRADAHCDTMDGPVVAAARRALEIGDVAPALMWVTADRENELRSVFAKAVVARKASPAARSVADSWFFETIARLHRAGEGEPYTGLLPAGTPVEPAIREAESAVASGDVRPLASALASALDAGVRSRFQRVVETRRSADRDVLSGRAYVAAYVDYMHFIERLHEDLVGTKHAHHGATPAGPAMPR